MGSGLSGEGEDEEEEECHATSATSLPAGSLTAFPRLAIGAERTAFILPTTH